MVLACCIKASDCAIWCRLHTDLAACTCRTMILAGLAAALICGALWLRQLGGPGSKAKQTLPAEVSLEANARVLREMGEMHATGGALFEHSQEADEPCGDSCTKDHVHTHTLTVRPQCASSRKLGFACCCCQDARSPHLLTCTSPSEHGCTAGLQGWQRFHPRPAATDAVTAVSHGK